jgi:hypothetical protein
LPLLDLLLELCFTQLCSWSHQWQDNFKVSLELASGFQDIDRCFAEIATQSRSLYSSWLCLGLTPILVAFVTTATRNRRPNFGPETFVAQLSKLAAVPILAAIAPQDTAIIRIADVLIPANQDYDVQGLGVL